MGGIRSAKRECLFESEKSAECEAAESQILKHGRGKAEMVPTAAVISGPGRGVPLSSRIRGPGKNEGADFWVECAQAFKRCSRILHAIHVVNLGVGRGAR